MASLSLSELKSNFNDCGTPPAGSNILACGPVNSKCTSNIIADGSDGLSELICRARAAASVAMTPAPVSNNRGRLADAGIARSIARRDGASGSAALKPADFHVVGGIATVQHFEITHHERAFFLSK